MLTVVIRAALTAILIPIASTFALAQTFRARANSSRGNVEKAWPAPTYP